MTAHLSLRAAILAALTITSISIAHADPDRVSDQIAELQKQTQQAQAEADQAKAEADRLKKEAKQAQAEAEQREQKRKQDEEERLKKSLRECSEFLKQMLARDAARHYLKEAKRAARRAKRELERAKAQDRRSRGPVIPDPAPDTGSFDIPAPVDLQARTRENDLKRHCRALLAKHDVVAPPPFDPKKAAQKDPFSEGALPD